MLQSKPLRNGLLIAGISITVVGIALSCIPHTAAVMTGQVCLTLGVPILAMGVILAIYQKATEAPRTGETEQQESAFGRFLNQCRRNRVGSNQNLTPPEVRNQRLRTLTPDNEAQQQDQNANPN